MWNQKCVIWPYRFGPKNENEWIVWPQMYVLTYTPRLYNEIPLWNRFDRFLYRVGPCWPKVGPFWTGANLDWGRFDWQPSWVRYGGVFFYIIWLVTSCSHVTKMAASGVFFFGNILFLTILSTAQAAWNTNDYLKREHTLVKPYQGNSTFRSF